MSGAFALVNVDLNAKAGEVDAPRVGSLCTDPLPLRKKIVRGGGSLNSLRVGGLSI